MAQDLGAHSSQVGLGGEGSRKAMPSLVFSIRHANSMVKGGRIMLRQIVGDKALTKISPLVVIKKRQCMDGSPKYVMVGYLCHKCMR